MTLTDIEKRIFLSAIGRERKICEVTDKESPGEINLVKVCDSIERKVKDVLWEEKEVDYKDCSLAMMKMWIDKVITDGEYYRIMGKLNESERKRVEVGNGTQEETED